MKAEAAAAAWAEALSLLFCVLKFVTWILGNLVTLEEDSFLLEATEVDDAGLLSPVFFEFDTSEIFLLL